MLASRQLTGGIIDAATLTRLRAAFGRIARELNVTATGEGLSPTQASVLALIASHGPLGLSDLANLEGINPTMLSRVVGVLSEMGLIQRLPNPADLRAALVEATDQGLKTYEHLRATKTEFVSRSLEQLPKDTVTALLDVIPALEQLAAELRKSNAES